MTADLGWSIGEGALEPERAPTAIGPWRIEGELGRGGGGVVYRARDAAGRAVALKALLPHAPDRVRERLQREGELAARLTHAGIVRLLDRGLEGAQAGGDPWLAYELIEGGRSLRQALPTLAPEAGARLILAVARAVAHAHAQGVVHRDLKPENVLLTGDGAPRVIDFGLGGADDLERLTVTGALVGTPTYMPPEQLTGARERQGPASDVWALGALLFEVLSGRPPFPDLTLMALREAILNGPTPAPSQVAPETAPALDAVVRRALAREPALRYPDAGAFADALEAALRAPARPRRRAVQAAVAACGLLALLGGWALAASSSEGPRLPAPQPSNGPPAPLDSRASGGDPIEAAWLAARAAPPGSRPHAVWRWLRAHPDHARAAEARAALAELAAQGPVAVLGAWDGPTRVAFLADGTLVCAGGSGRGWARHLTVEGEELGAWSLAGPVVALSAQGALALVGGNDLPPTLLTLTVTPGGGRPEPRRLDLPPSPVLALDPRGERIAIGRHQAVEVRRVDGEGAPLVLPIDGDYPATLAFAEQGALLLAGIAPGHQLEVAHLAAWELPEGRALPRQSSYDVAVTLCLGPDLVALGDAFGHLLVVGPRGGRAGVVPDDPDLVRPEMGYRPSGHLGAVRGLAAAPDGARLYSLARVPATGGYELRAWDPHTGQRLADWPERPASPRSLAISPPGDLLAVGTDTGTVELWLLP